MTAAAASSGVTVSGFASTVTSRASGSAASSRSSASAAVNVGVPPPRKIVSSSGASSVPLELELAQERLDVRAVLPRPADDRDEVAVATPVRAERKVDVEVRDAHLRPSWPMLSTARNASCGTSTAPTCFIRFFPAFCFSSSFRLRVMSPP